jgi:hypothetical protein
MHVTEGQVLAANEAIMEYMTIYRDTFKQELTVLPKQHMLEKHMCSWMKTWQTGMATFGEQGGEQLHARIDEMKKSA